MALDGVYLSLIKSELSPVIIGSRVDKIHQPSRDSIVVTLRTQGQGSKKLLLSSSAGTARVHLTSREPENPKVPPMFCMLLRKHLSSARLAGIRQDGFERILFFDFESTDDFGDRVNLTLAAEIMGRCSNILLVGPDGRVIDSIKRVSEDMSRVRRVLPGIEYTLPPRDDRLNPLDFSEEELFERLSAQNAELSKALVRVFEGISPIIAREAAFFAARGAEKMSSELDGGEKTRLAWFFKETARKIAAGENRYYILKDRDGMMRDFAFIKINQYGSLMFDREFSSPSELLDVYYSQRDVLAQTKQRADDLFKLIVSLSERTRRRVSAQKLELEDCRGRDALRIKGDLIMANLYRLERGMNLCRLENFYEDGSPETEIELDPRLTPSQNAQKYYSEYRKADTADKMLRKLIEKGEEEEKYLDSVFDSLSRASTEAELSEIRAELADGGYIKSRGAKQSKTKPLPPSEYRSSDGFRILAGRNNRQNDLLTLKLAEKSDVWLHVKNMTGSHVIICCEGGEPSETAITEAAKIAAKNSSAKNGSQVPVDYTLVRYVKKPSGAKPGMVIYTNQRTVYVTPEGE